MSDPSAPETAPPRARFDSVIDAGFTVALVLLALSGFRTSFGGQAWLWAGGLGLALGLAVAYATTARRVSIAITVPVAAAVAVLFAPLVLPDTAIAVVLPSLDTLTALIDGGLRGWISLLSVVPPIGSTYHLLAVPYLAALVCAVVTYCLARRSRWVWPPVVTPAVLLVLSILFGIDQPAAPLLQGALFAAVALAWVALRISRGEPAWHPGRRSHRLFTAVPVLVAVVAGGYLLGPALPGATANPRHVLRDTATPPFDPHEYPSPLGRFRDYVTKQRDTTLLQVTGLQPGTRMRLATMDTYDGLVWSVAGGDGPAAGSSGWFEKIGASIPLPQNLPDGATPAKVSVTVKALDGVWLPDVGELTKIAFTGPRAAALDDSFRYNRLTGTAAVPAWLGEGDGYTFESSVLPAMSMDDVVGHALQPDSQPSATNIPEEISSFAGDAVEDVDDPLARVEKLRKTLTEGYYSDGGRNEAVSLPGHGSRRLAEMFQADNYVGNDEQYAAAAALALRVLSVPSRVVMGFVVNPKHPTTLTGADVTAWVEVPVDGAGWVVVDPTPDENRKLTDQKPRPKPKPRTQNQPQPPPPVVAPDQEVQATQSQPRRDHDDQARTGVGRLLIVVGWAALPLLLLLAAALLVIGLKARRRRRRRNAERPTEAIVGGWLEVTDLARDLRTPVPTPSTRREGARLLATSERPSPETSPEISPPTDLHSVVALAERADATVFGPGEPTRAEVEDFWRDVGRARGDLLGGYSRWQRLRAHLTVRSLRKH